MPTISRLPAADDLSSADLLPISQGGSVHAISVGALLAHSQPAIAFPSPALLGRVSLGPGGPEAISIGSGLTLSNATLTAQGLDAANIPIQAAPGPADRMFGERNGELQRVEFGEIRQLFSAGPNISIDNNGVISAAAPDADLSRHLSTLAALNSVSSGDLLGVSHAGEDRVVSYGNLINGIAIEQAGAANPASDTDTFWTGQAGSTMTRQTLGEVWRLFMAKLPLFRRPAVELTGAIAIAGELHNNAVLVCAVPLVLDGTPAGLGVGFSCDVINASSGIVSFSSNLAVQGGIATVLPGQCRAIRCVAVNGYLTVFAGTSSGGTLSTAPGGVVGVTVQDQSSHSLGVYWLAPSSGGTPEGYVVQYRTAGASAWNYQYRPSGTLSIVLDGLSPATTYDLTVLAANGAGSGPGSDILHAATTAAIGAPGTPTGLSIANISANGLLVSWVAPSSGGPNLSYTLYQRVSGQTNWVIAASAIGATSSLVAGLTPDTSYDFQVVAANSSGTSAASQSVSGRTSAVVGLVTSIAWNLVPTATYPHGSGAIGVNVRVTPSNAAVQIGFSTSSISHPTAWTTASYVNTDLWGAYVPTPNSAGAWYAWAEGTDGSSPTVYASPFTVT